MYARQLVHQIIFGQHDLGDAGKQIRFMVPHPQKFGRREAREGDIARARAERLPAHVLIQERRLLGRAAVVPQNGRAQHLVLFIQGHQAVHLAPQADALHRAGVKARQKPRHAGQARGPPILRGLLAPARMRENEGVFLRDSVQHGARLIHQKELAGRSAHVYADIQHYKTPHFAFSIARRGAPFFDELAHFIRQVCCLQSFAVLPRFGADSLCKTTKAHRSRWAFLTILALEPRQQFQTFFTGIEPLRRVQAVAHARLFQHGAAALAAVSLRRHPQFFLKRFGKIAVIGKAGLHAHIQHLLPAGSDQAAGGVEAHGVYIILEALVQRFFHKMGQIAHRTVFRPGKVRQADLVHVVLFHKIQQPSQARAALFPLGRFLCRDDAHGHGRQQPVQQQAGLAQAEQLVAIRPLQIHPHARQQRLLCLPVSARSQIFVRVDIGDLDALQRRETLLKALGANLHTQKGAALPHFVEFVQLIGAHQGHLPRAYPMGALPAGDGKLPFHHPDQLPLRVHMGGAVIHLIEKQMQPVDLRVLDDLHFLHYLASHYVFVAKRYTA